MAAAIVLRRTNPELPSPFKTPLGPVIPVLGIVSCLAIIGFLPWQTDVRSESGWCWAW